MKRSLMASASLLLTIAFTSLPMASSRPASPPEGSYRTTVEHLIKDDGALVSRIKAEVRPGSMVRLVCDRAPQGGASCRAGEPKGPDRATSIVDVTVLGDLINFNGKPLRKFRVGMASGGASAVFSDAGPSASAEKLGDILSILIKPGTYREGDSIPAIKFEDRTYSLVVDAPKP